MRDAQKQDKKIIVIRLLAGFTALNMLAAGFTLMYKKKKEAEIAPTTNTMQESENSENLSGYDYAITNGPFNELKNGLSNTTMDENDNKTTVPVVNPIYNEIKEAERKYFPEVYEWKQQQQEKNLGIDTSVQPPYMAYDESRNKEEHYGYDYVTKNSPYNEIKDVLGKDNVQNNAPVDGLKEEPKIRTNPIYDKIRENTPYMDELHKQQLYEMDPSLNPLNRPPYQAAAENIEEYNKSK